MTDEPTPGDDKPDVDAAAPEPASNPAAAVGPGFAVDPGSARELAQAVARLGANEAIFKSVDLSAIIANLQSNVLANMVNQDDVAKLLTSAVLANKAQMDEIGRTFANSALFTTRILQESLSVDALYPAWQLTRAASAKDRTKPRPSRSAAEFFGTHAVDIDSVGSLLKALYTLQKKQHEHRLVWRGQQDSSWAVHSSLYRQLAEGGPVDEDRLVAAEVEELDHATAWGRDISRPLHFFADLQHHGAPTRLIDVSTDPEMACWFAVEKNPKHEEADGLVLAWGRSPRVGRDVPAPREDLPSDSGGVPFWHTWEDNERRRPADWGTGSRTWTWFPPALSDRMRAQRAGFLLEAGPILTPAVVEVFNDALPLTWRSSEIARATSIVGLPSRHDVLTKPNKARLVPVFALRILAQAKEEIRGYLEGKGLRYSSVYPDLGGLVQHLKGPYGPR